MRRTRRGRTLQGKGTEDMEESQRAENEKGVSLCQRRVFWDFDWVEISKEVALRRDASQGRRVLCSTVVSTGRVKTGAVAPC
jgi:hypothetical protein